MKLELVCPLCLALPQVDFEGQVQLVQTEVRDDGAYLSHCPKEHPFVTYLQQQLFEMLFELGVNAIVDGYYREAVSSFAASLERFYEYSMRVFMAAQAVRGEQWNEAWKPVANSSERQLGAYVFLHMASLHKPPPLLTGKQTAFRNGVVHKGKFPTADEAVRFGETVKGLINSGIHDLQQNFPGEMDVASWETRVIPKGTMPGMLVSSHHYPTVVTLMKMDLPDRNASSLDAIVADRRNRRSAV